MELDQVKAKLQLAIPEELYMIEPGQIVLYISSKGINQRTANNVSTFFRYFRKLYRFNEVNLIFVPTDNELLIGHLVGRNPNEVGIPYKIAISDWDTLAGFAAEYFGEKIENIIERVPPMGVAPISISATDLPIIVSLDPNNIKENLPEANDGFDPFDMELKLRKPDKGSKEEKALKAKMDKKLEKVLRECAIFEIEPDIDRIKKKVAKSLNSPVEYKLSLDIEFMKEDDLSFCSTCEIYVSDGDNYKLELTAVEKAIYLSFLLYENGIRVIEASDTFRRVSQKIYNQLPDEDKCIKTAGGILDKGDVNSEVYAKTLRGYISKIRDEVDRNISHPLVAQDFAIEGFKDKEFGIARSTPEIRAQIKEAFNL